MNWPGEKLIIKLWESLAEKGVGSLLKPWQIRREGRANVDLRRYEMLALADAEREAEEIRSGKRNLGNAKYVLSMTEESRQEDYVDQLTEAPLLELASRSAVVDAMRREVNVAKAVLHAEEELSNDNSEPQKEKPDDDWIYRWRDYAGSVSCEELQAIWGRILAGELKAPGQYSYRLLEFVKNLTKDEAALIETIAPFVVKDIVVRDQDAIFQESGATFDVFLKLQELGILSGVEALGLTKTFNSNSKDRFLMVLTCHGRGLLVEHSDPSKTLKLGVYILTSLGLQAIKLGKFGPNEKYLRALGEKIQKSDFKVSLIDYTDVGDGLIHYSNQSELPRGSKQEGIDQPATSPESGPEGCSE